MRARRGNGAVHPHGDGEEAQVEGDRAEDQGGAHEGRTLRGPAWQALGRAHCSKPGLILADDFSTLGLRRVRTRYRVARGILRVLS